MSWGVRDSRYFEPTNFNWDSESTGLCHATNLEALPHSCGRQKPV